MENQQSENKGADSQRKAEHGGRRQKLDRLHGKAHRCHMLDRHSHLSYDNSLAKAEFCMARLGKEIDLPTLRFHIPLLLQDARTVDPCHPFPVRQLIPAPDLVNHSPIRSQFLRRSTKRRAKLSEAALR